MKMIFRKGSKLKRRADNKRNDTKSIIARPLFSFTLLPSDSFLSVATTFTTVDVIVRPNVTGDRKKKKS